MVNYFLRSVGFSILCASIPFKDSYSLHEYLENNHKIGEGPIYLRLIGGYLKEMIYYGKLNVYREALLSGVLRELMD